MNDLGLEPIDRFGERIVVEIANAADRRLDAGRNDAHATFRAELASPSSRGLNTWSER